MPITGLNANSAQALFLVVLAFMLSPDTWAAKCSIVSGEQSERPQWIDTPTSSGDEGVRAVGVASASDIPLPEAIHAARAQAARAMAEMIQVAITGQVSIIESKLSSRGEAQARSTVRSITDSVTSATFEQLAFDKQWLDVKGCRVWMRAFMTRADFDRNKSANLSAAIAKQLEFNLSLAESASQSPASRQGALEVAEILIASPELGYSFANRIPAFQARLAAVRPHVKSNALAANQAEAASIAHAQAFSRYEAETSPARRKTLARDALASLRQVLALKERFPGLDLGFDAYQRFVFLSLDAGYPCSAKETAERDPASLGRLPAATRKSLSEASCGPDQRASEKLREYLVGKRVQISCTVRLADKSLPWKKACATLRQSFSVDGASVEEPQRAPKDPPPGSLVVVLNAEGRMATRVSSNDSGTEAHRFEGIIKMELHDVDGPNIEDSFQALTGWNPVSEEMVVDILGINASKKLVEKLKGFWN